MDFPNTHRIPLDWLLEHGNETVRYRTLTELAPAGYASPERIEEAREAVVQSKLVTGILKKQKETGIWGSNLLAVAPSAKDGIKEVGTVPQYRRLLQLGAPASLRAFKLSDRVLFRMLSRDEDPALHFEYAKAAKAEPLVAPWVREAFREASAAALAEAGHQEDPRLRGAAHKIANAISTFLRSPVSEKPFVKVGKVNALHPEAHPPTWYSVAMIAQMPNLQRERAGFTERLGHYLSLPAPKKEFVVMLGKKALRPNHLLLGDPIEADARGVAKDLPLSLHYVELLSRMGALAAAPVATKVLARTLRDVDDRGVWLPKGLRTSPKAINRLTYHWYPLQADEKGAESRSVDLTFRLALIAKLLGLQLDYA